MTAYAFFAHQTVITSLRYLLDGLDEEQVLEVEKSHPLANVSLTMYRRTGAGMVLEVLGDTSAVDAYGADLTHEESAAEVRHG